MVRWPLALAIPAPTPRILSDLLDEMRPKRGRWGRPIEEKWLACENSHYLRPRSQHLSSPYCSRVPDKLHVFFIFFILIHPSLTLYFVLAGWLSKNRFLVRFWLRLTKPTVSFPEVSLVTCFEHMVSAERPCGVALHKSASHRHDVDLFNFVTSALSTIPRQKCSSFPQPFRTHAPCGHFLSVIL